MNPSQPPDPTPNARIENTLELIRAVLHDLPRPGLECDGTTRIVSRRLSDVGIRHWTMVGYVRWGQNGDRQIPLHFWVDLIGPLEGWRVDFTLPVWLAPDPTLPILPVGLFQPATYPALHYHGTPAILPTISAELEAILLYPLDIPKD